MNEEIKKRWVEALRSGEYRQGKSDLRRTRPEGKPEFCCLGVLCDLYREKRGGHWESNEFVPVPGKPGRGGYLPKAVMEWAGLDSGNPSIDHEPIGGRTAASMNDGGFDFNAIADMIEQNL